MQRSVKAAPTTNLWNILADNEFRLHSGYIFAVSNASLLLSQNAVTFFFQIHFYISANRVQELAICDLEI